MRRGSTKPCPGCGKVKDRRRSDEVCHECHKDLKEVAEVRAKWADHVGEYTCYTYSQTSHWNAPHMEGSMDHKDRDALDEALCDLVWTVGQPVLEREQGWNTSHPRLFKLRQERSVREAVRLLPEVAVALQRLDAAIRVSLQLAHESGRRKGLDLLEQIAQGDISVTEFNELDKPRRC